MAPAIVAGRPHRASGALAFHVLEVMEAFQTSSDEGRHVTIESRGRAARHAAGRPARPASSTEPEGTRSNDNAQGNDRLGRLERPRARAVRLHRPRLARRRRASRSASRPRPQAFADPAIADLRLIVPIYTMSKIEKEEVANLVRGGARRRRPRRLSRRHVRRLPRGGRLPVHVRRPVGRPSRQHHRLPRQHHAARTTRSWRASATSTTAPSSTTCMSTRRTRCWRRRPSPASTRRWIEGVVMPVVWKKRYGEGRVFYSSLGHRRQGVRRAGDAHDHAARPALGGALAYRTPGEDRSAQIMRKQEPGADGPMQSRRLPAEAG